MVVLWWTYGHSLYWYRKKTTLWILLTFCSCNGPANYDHPKSNVLWFFLRLKVCDILYKLSTNLHHILRDSCLLIRHSKLADVLLLASPDLTGISNLRRSHHRYPDLFLWYRIIWYSSKQRNVDAIPGRKIIR